MSRYLHHPFYCEENAWHLSGDPRLPSGRRVVVVVSNRMRSVAMWHQCLAQDPSDPVVWDYHVFVLVRSGATTRVWDLDSRLGLDVDARVYFRESFRPVSQNFRPMFRLIPAEVYRTKLATDRRHMRTASGRYHSPPPSWPTIGTGHNLDRVVDPCSDFLGEMVPTERLEEWLQVAPTQSLGH